jgi:hypothetical protein
VHSSTSSSSVLPMRPMPTRAAIKIAVWTLVWLVLVDVAINLAFAPPGTSQRPSGLQRYFDYGRSVEGKLLRSVTPDPKTSAPIIPAGWIDAQAYRALPSERAAGSDMLIAAYGQSFTLNALHEAARLDGKLTLRPIGGPAAPPSHAYAAFQADEPMRKADVVLLGLLSSSVVHLSSLSGLIWSFENPAPYTFPRYRVQDGRLVEEQPLIRSEREFREAFLAQSTAWKNFREQLRRSDRGYDRFIFDHDLSDRSSLVRLARRGWVAHSQRYDEGVHTPGRGFEPQSQEAQALKAIVVDMARRCRARGERLVVMLLHVNGHGQDLYDLMRGTLEAEGIEYVSSHAVLSANDPSNFLPDGHYKDGPNRRLAQALQRQLRSPASR